MRAPFRTVSKVDCTAVMHAIERAAMRERQVPRDDMVGRLDVILEEFANILGAYVAYRDAAVAAVNPPEPEDFHSPKPTVLQ